MAAVWRNHSLIRRVLKPFRVSSARLRNLATVGVDSENLGDGEMPLAGGLDEEEIYHEDNFKLYDGHIPLTCLQRTLLAAGSAVTALYEPRRHDMVAALGETTGYLALRRMHQKMQSDPVGRQILRLKPRITSETVRIDELRKLPDGTFGREYARFLDTNGISPDTRMPVRFVDDTALAYVMQRYREIHDFVHVLTGLSNISVASEIAVKWFELIQTGLPMCGLSAFFGPLGFHQVSSQERSQLRKDLIPWAVTAGLRSKNFMNVFYEQRFEELLEDLQRQMNLSPAPTTV